MTGRKRRWGRPVFTRGKILEKKEKKEYTVVEKKIIVGGEFDKGVYPERRIEL